jgi:hypothetical protein
LQFAQMIQRVFLGACPAEVWVIDRFVQGVREGQGAAFSFEQAYQALRWLRAARQSRTEGRRVEIGPL